LEVCKYLVEKGADPLLPNAEGTVPLHWAAGSGNFEVLKWLLDEQHSLLESRNVFGCTVAHFASSGGQLGEITKMRDLEIVNSTVYFESRLNVLSACLLTITTILCGSYDVEMCKYLHDIRGADFLECNLHGHDPLTKAIAFKRNNVARWLLESVSGCQETVTQLRPWDDDCMKSLWQIAELVGNTEGVSLLNEFL
jgi:ankyrin repeat protein